MTETDRLGVTAVLPCAMDSGWSRRNLLLAASAGTLGWTLGWPMATAMLDGLQWRVLPGLFVVAVDRQRGGLWVPLASGELRWFKARDNRASALAELGRALFGPDTDLWGPEWRGVDAGPHPRAVDLLKARFDGRWA